MQREVDTTRERMERLQSMGCADYLHMALLDRAERAEAERDAAFAAGQEEMRERAAKAYDAGMAWDTFGAFTRCLRALPIKDGPDGR